MFEFDDAEALKLIKENYEIIDKISEALSVKRNTFVNFANDLSIEMSKLRRYISTSEATLVIDCYTYSERLLKNTIYEVLEFGRHENPFIREFLDKKLSRVKFIPNVKYESFSRELAVCNKNFKLLIGPEHMRVKVYDAMVNSRHLYAHTNTIPQNLNTTKDVIVFLEYLSWECKRYINYYNYQDNIQDDLKKLIDMIHIGHNYCKTNKKLSSSMLISEITSPNLEDLFLQCKDFITKYNSELGELSIFEEFIQAIQSGLKIDFKTCSGETYKNYIINLYNVYDNLKLQSV